jgi:hypothetical protein
VSAYRASWHGAPVPIRVAGVILAIEALGLTGLGLFEIISAAVGDPNSVGRALFGGAFALLGAAALLLGARGLLLLRPAARTPMVVLQLLAIPVSYSLAFQAGRVAYGAPILVAALTVLYLVFTPPARAALDREPPR